MFSVLPITVLAQDENKIDYCYIDDVYVYEFMRNGNGRFENHTIVCVTVFEDGEVAQSNLRGNGYAFGS